MTSPRALPAHTDEALKALADWNVPTADALVSELQAYLPSASGELLRHAWMYGGAMHHGQRRKSGEPYFAHPVAVARLIMKLRLDEASVCAGLLHDVVEDTKASADEIANRFSTVTGEQAFSLQNTKARPSVLLATLFSTLLILPESAGPSAVASLIS